MIVTTEPKPALWRKALRRDAVPTRRGRAVRLTLGDVGNGETQELPLAPEGQQAMQLHPDLECKTFRSYQANGAYFDQTQCRQPGKPGFYDAVEIIKTNGALVLQSDENAHSPDYIARWQAQLDADTAAQIARANAAGDSWDAQMRRLFPWNYATPADLQRLKQQGTAAAPPAHAATNPPTNGGAASSGGTGSSTAPGSTVVSIDLPFGSLRLPSPAQPHFGWNWSPSAPAWLTALPWYAWAGAAVAAGYWLTEGKHKR